jgi:hypothetical protein
MCELLVGLPDVDVNGVGDWPRRLRIAISTRSGRPACPECGGRVWSHDRIEVELVDLPCFGRKTRLVWSKQRWRGPNAECSVVTFVEADDRIVAIESERLQQGFVELERLATGLCAGECGAKLRRLVSLNSAAAPPADEPDGAATESNNGLRHGDPRDAEALDEHTSRHAM